MYATGPYHLVISVFIYLLFFFNPIFMGNASLLLMMFDTSSLIHFGRHSRAQYMLTHFMDYEYVLFSLLSCRICIDGNTSVIEVLKIFDTVKLD